MEIWRSDDSISQQRANENFMREKQRARNLDKKQELYIFYNTTLLQTDFSFLHEKLHTVVVIGQPKIIPLYVLGDLINLKELWMVECGLRDITSLTKSTSLERLYLYSNDIREMPVFSEMKQLRILSIARNKISDIEGLRDLIALRDLNVAANDIRKICDTFSSRSKLLHINLAGNPINDLQDVESLCSLKKLENVEFDDPVYGKCPLIETHLDHRQYLIRILPNLQEIDYYPIRQWERESSNKHEISFNKSNLKKYLLNGSFEPAFITKTFNSNEFLHIKYLAIVGCSILQENLRDIFLPQLESLDLSNNLIESLEGLRTLKNLRTLCVSHNKLGTRGKNIGAMEKTEFPSTVVLYADNNEIRSVVDAGIPRMPTLEHIYLQDNLLIDLNGIQDFPNLRTAVLDNNKFEGIVTNAFTYNIYLRTLFLENNKLTDLKFAKKLRSVEQLFLANNRITNKDQLTYLSGLKGLVELTVLGNPFCTRRSIYQEIRERIKTIELIDGYSTV